MATAPIVFTREQLEKFQFPTIQKKRNLEKDSSIVIKILFLAKRTDTQIDLFCCPFLSVSCWICVPYSIMSFQLGFIYLTCFRQCTLLIHTPKNVFLETLWHQTMTSSRRLMGIFLNFPWKSLPVRYSIVMEMVFWIEKRKVNRDRTFKNVFYVWPLPQVWPRPLLQLIFEFLNRFQFCQ